MKRKCVQLVCWLSQLPTFKVNIDTSSDEMSQPSYPHGHYIIRSLWEISFQFLVLLLSIKLYFCKLLKLSWLSRWVFRTNSYFCDVTSHKMRTNHFAVWSDWSWNHSMAMPQQSVRLFIQRSEASKPSLISTPFRESALAKPSEMLTQSMRQTTNDRQTTDHTYKKPLGVGLRRVGSNKRNVATQKMAQQMWPFAPFTSGERRHWGKASHQTPLSAARKHVRSSEPPQFPLDFQRGGGSFPKWCAKPSFCTCASCWSDGASVKKTA